jgi:glycosyltransferase involved in cell wall biosynthesis
MILVDALYINVGGGKILLNYIIEEFKRSNIDVFYLLDLRLAGKHSHLEKEKFVYLEPSFIKRHFFYKKNINKFSKILCFGNLPPSMKMRAEVFTYFHQTLYLKIENEIPFLQKITLKLKVLIWKKLIKNSNYWLVQSNYMKHKLEKKIGLNTELNYVIPFYPPIAQAKLYVQRKKQFVYISSGESHKNHFRLLDAFTQFNDLYQGFELHLTVEKKFDSLYKAISKLREKGYPIVNHEYLDRELLGQLYRESEFLIYPSLAESFGLGILEAIESGCKVIGADLPYMNAVCIPSLLFNPESVPDMIVSLKKAIKGDIQPSKQIVFNEIEKLVNIFKEN